MLGHAIRQFVFANKHLARVFRAQQFRLFLAMRAHHRQDGGVQRARRLDHGTHVEGVRRGDDEHGGMRDVCLDQHGRFARIAGHGRNALLAQLVDDFTVFLGHNKVDAPFHQRGGDAPAHAPIADEDDLARQFFLRHGHRQLGQRVRRAFELAREVAVADHAQQRLGHAEDERVEGDRQDGAGQDQALPFLRHQAQRQAQRGQDERELADLRQAGRDDDGRFRRIAQRHHEQKGGDRFAEDNDGAHGQHLQGLVDEDIRLEQHADGNEEQHGERVAQG
ncbi:hypothetical protein D3C72_1434950 [compost metagenome]